MVAVRGKLAMPR